MCCSKDLTPKPLLFLLLRAPSSLTGVDASCLSLQSCGEPRLLLSDLYCKWTQHKEETNGKKQDTEKRAYFLLKILTSLTFVLFASWGSAVVHVVHKN